LAIGASGPRGPRLDEYLEAMIAIWTQESATYHGRWIDFEDLDVFPKPVQKPHPPIVIGGRSDHALRRTARYASGWVPSQVSVAEIEAGAEKLRAWYAQEGRSGPDDIGINMYVAIAATDEAADELAHPTASRVFPDEEQYRARTVVGSPETFTRRLREYIAAGVTFLEMRPVYRTVDELIDQMRMMTELVLPALEE
jgi:alkanesulfonate monooxygenase SsuD/methylene tetrahydromethanopterin reductase-like flavin-dependent oxidoreductase (luciferase family)